MMTLKHIHRQELIELAENAMLNNGLEPHFSSASMQQLASIQECGLPHGGEVRDHTDLPWCSIDNDDSRDLDQLSVSIAQSDNSVHILVAVADVDALVRQDTPIDLHARHNTTSVYTGAVIFPMLPERLSTGLTSLNPDGKRLAIVSDLHFDADGSLRQADIHRAWVHNKAKLAYDSVSAWLDGNGPLPEAAAAVPGMDQQLRTQDAVAQRLRALRHEQGALEFQSFQPKAVFDGDQVVEVRQQEQNRARQLIEEFMIATNGATARYLAAHKRSSLRRVVRSPERWMRIVEVAAEYGDILPALPDPVALEQFLARRRAADPERFPDLSLTIIKLMGAGEYVVEVPGGPSLGHFGLAVRDYTHSTAPNRRYPDLITARLLKAALKNQPAPYSDTELAELGAHCTRQEDAANKVERQMRKSEVALVLHNRLGEVFEGFVTGASKGNTWVRIFAPPAEGKLLTGPNRQMRVGRRVQVRLQSTDVERGHIDFELLP